VHAHGNNGEFPVKGIPPVIELTYVNKNYFGDDVIPELNRKPLPDCNLDFQNRKDRPDIDLNMYPFVNKISPENILISVTTVPRRINTCLRTAIQSIKNQSVKCKIIINVPIHYSKWKDSDIHIPEEFFRDDLIIVNRSQRDYGPSTKLLGAIEYLNDKHHEYKFVITMDDDIEYKDKYHIEKIIKNIQKNPSYVNAIHSINVIPNQHGCILSYNNKGFVDVPGDILALHTLYIYSTRVNFI
jgi:hypothetical protein